MAPASQSSMRTAKQIHLDQLRLESVPMPSTGSLQWEDLQVLVW